MKFIPDPKTSPQQKMAAFHRALGAVLSVSKDELKRREVEDERIRRAHKGKPGPKPSSTSAHASDSED